MIRRGDERAVTVQIGAVLLLAILVSALALWQTSVVPDENQNVEFDHSQAVRGELVELRDAIRTTALDRNERGVPISLGLQYDTRAVMLNPPDPSGTISTTDPRPVTFEGANATDEAVQAVLDSGLETRLLTYEPGYNEYDGPTTVLEHTLLYGEFGHANVTHEDQRFVAGDRLTLVLVDGDLSRSSSGTVSVSVEPLAGPTPETTLRREDEENVTITLPTNAPERWEESLGRTFGANSGHPDARIQPDGDRENVTIELADEDFRLRLAQVSVGDDAERNEPIETARSSNDEPVTDPSPVEASGPLEIEWVVDGATMEERETRSFDVRITDAETGDPVADASVDFSRLGNDVLEIEGQGDETDADGNATVSVSAREVGETALLSSTATDTARLPITVEEGDSHFHVGIDSTNSPIEAGETLTVETTVENLGDAGADTVVLETSDGIERDNRTLTLDSGELTTIALEWQTGAGDAGERDVTVSSADTSDATTVDVTEAGGGGTTATIDDFERDEPIAWGPYYGDTGSFETTTDAATSGTRSLYGAAPSSDGTAVLLSAGRDHQPVRGESVRFDLRPATADADGSFLFGGWGESNSYGVRIDAANDRLELSRDGRVDDGGVELASESVAFDQDAWYDVQIDWGTEQSDTIVVTVRDENGVELATIETDDGTYDEGIVGVEVGPNGLYLDDLRAIVPDGA